jgi:hypothetical protein
MLFRILVEKYNKKYNEGWLEYTLDILSKPKCNLELGDLFRNPNLSEELYNKLEFIIKNKDNEINNGYLQKTVFIRYDKILYRTPFYLEDRLGLKIYAMINPNFGFKYINEFFNSLSSSQFFEIFSGLQFSVSEINIYSICGNSCFTPEFILKNIGRYIGKEKTNEEINQNITAYLKDHNELFWNKYSKIRHTTIDRHITWPWNWCNILKFSEIGEEFIEKNRVFIINKIYTYYSISVPRFSIVTAEELFKINIIYNNTIPWDYKERIIDLGFNLEGIYTNKLMLSHNIGIPDSIVRDIIYNKNNRYYDIIYHIFKDNFVRYNHLPQNIVDFIYRNHRAFIRPKKISNYELSNLGKDMSILLKCSSMDFVHDMFYCKYVNISVDTIKIFNNKQKEDYLDIEKMNLQLNKSFGWYQHNKLNFLYSKEKNKNVEYCFDIELDKYADYAYNNIIIENKSCRLEYLSDRLNFELNIRKLQNWWKKILYNPHISIGKKFAEKNIDFAFQS